MKVLFVPCAGTPVPHLIPLVALASRLSPDRHQTAFLVRRSLHTGLGAIGLRALDIDYVETQAFRTEIAAYRQFRPDVVVDDLSATALLSTTLTKRPRVTIRRTGDFPGAGRRNSAHQHSAIAASPHFFDSYRNCQALGIQPPATLADVCRATMNIIPGVPSIETLPAELERDPTYVFAGPLVAPDRVCGALVGAQRGGEPDASALSQFLERHRDRGIVYVTLGTVLQAGDRISAVVNHILAAGHAIVSSVEPPPLRPAASDRCFYAPVLPIDRVASQAHFMIHHCGSGTYQYQIRHELPSICVGSRCYDRDDVAIRLDELGVANYVPAADDPADFVARFQRAFDTAFDVSGEWYRRASERLRTLKAETERVAQRFDFESVLQEAVSRGPRPAPQSRPGVGAI
jgi:hypothetical protein